MKRMIESLTGGYASSARVVDGTLVLSLPDAISPVVWRMDLGQVRSSALEVREQKDGIFMLALKTPRDDVHDIAPFASRALAVRALMAVSRALENGQGQTRSSASLLNSEPNIVTPRQGGIGKWLICVVAIIILILLLEILAHAAPRSTSFGAASTSGAGTASSMAGGNVDTPGVPVSADDYLRQTPKQP